MRYISRNTNRVDDYMKNRNLKHRDDWQTPEYIKKPLDDEFHFDFDPCPTNPTFNGLLIEWKERNFINPPYSIKLKNAFIRKAYMESLKGKLCVMLLPVSTSTKIFHKYIYHNAEIRFVERRIKFCGYNTKGEYTTNKSGMHDSMIVIFRPIPNGDHKTHTPLRPIYQESALVGGEF